MSSNPVLALTRRRRDQRGAAVVEAALVISFFLIPILVGVLTLGEKLWQAQKHNPYEPRLAATDVYGLFSCDELVDRVKQTVVDNSTAAGTPVELAWVDAHVVEVVPTVGVLVEVQVSIPAADGGPPLVKEATSRLDNVRLSTETCL